jgi:hypothetical protein
MRGALILSLLPALVFAADLKIDHVTIAGSSLPTGISVFRLFHTAQRPWPRITPTA